MDVRACGGCGAEITPGPRERNKRKWCSESCRGKVGRREGRHRDTYYPRCSVAFPNCLDCGDVFSARSSRAEVCAGCRKRRNALTAKRAMRAWEEEHGISWDSRWRDTLRANARERYAITGRTEHHRRNDHVRRARIAGVVSEKFDVTEVFERDGWVCGICSLPVEQDVKWPDPMSPSLDHVVPLSRGGDHTKANTRCSHLICNVRLGNRNELVREGVS